MRSRAYAGGLSRLVRVLISRMPLTVLLILAFAIGLVSLRYLSGDLAFVPPSMQASFAVNGWVFVAHATVSALALMVGGVQLLSSLRRHWPGVHRWGGRLYLLFCVVGALSALWIAPDIESGWVATFGFSALAVAWIGTTVQGWRQAVNRRFDAHRRWMLRSYALTAAAITLRLQLVAFEAMGFDYNQISAVLSLSCWLPNIAVVEAALILAHRRKGSA